ncbi:kinase-like domain-containing protein [Aspergillus filifer]
MAAIIRKYGDIVQVTGLGDYAVVLQSHKVQYCPPLDRYYALKVFRARPDESREDYEQRVTSEFAIVSDLDHQNIIREFELLPIGAGNLCTCMEYCAGGDLHSLITATRKVPEDEANCLLKQLLRGVRYLHEGGIAHRDLKPENLLLTHRGCLKISDFGHAERFRDPGDDNKSHVRLAKGRRNSRPYLSPEQWLDTEFDPRCVDVWAAAIVHVAMRTGRNMWKEATEEDEQFKQFKETGKNALLDQIYSGPSRATILRMLSIDPTTRPSAAEVLASDWLQSVHTCVPPRDA